VILHNSQHNIGLALGKFGVSLRHNVFTGQMVYSQNNGPLAHLDDAAIDRFWLMIDSKFLFRPTQIFFYTVVQDLARRQPFHPVCDYLDGLTWDRVHRLDDWLIKYGGAEASEYSRAVGAHVLIAAVRRVRRPGTKFDEMLILEGAQ